MANPQHIEWLLEGVESWNARREREDFIPDLEGADLRDIFDKAGKLGRADRIPLQTVSLSRAKLKGAHLQRADLRDADLSGAFLWEADLSETYLWGANLRGAYLSEAKLWGADLRDADLRMADFGRFSYGIAMLKGANARTIVYSAARGSEVTVGFTDLSTTHLSQSQLNTMEGDSGTILPEGLERPAHWPELGPETQTGEQPPEPVPPSLPPEPRGNRVELKEVRLALGADEPVPERSDLETLFLDLRDAIEDLSASGGLHNLSPLLA